MKNIIGIIIGIGMGLIFGGGMLVGGYWMHDWQTAVQDYVSTQGTVLSSQVAEKRDEDGTQYSPDIAYKYTVDGEKYENNSYYYIDFSTSNRGWAADAVKKYPEGEQCTVYYSPDKPQNSVLVKDTDKLGFLAWLPYILMSVGGLILLIPLGLILYVLLVAGVLVQSWKNAPDRGESASGSGSTVGGREDEDDDSSGSGGIPSMEEI